MNDEWLLNKIKWIALIILAIIFLNQNNKIIKGLENVSSEVRQLQGTTRSGFGARSQRSSLDDINDSIRKTNSLLQDMY